MNVSAQLIVFRSRIKFDKMRINLVIAEATCQNGSNSFRATKT